MKPLRILYLEDEPTDTELVRETLEGDGIACRITRVETRANFIASLEQGELDLILADYTLPSFDGLSALEIAREKTAHLPFIFVSGSLDEEVAIESLKNGATDYVFKTRLSRLAPSVQRALREAKERVELSRTEEALKRSLEDQNRMARDIHDKLAQGFIAIVVQVQAAEDAIAKGLKEDAAKHLQSARDLGRLGLNEARRSVHALNPLGLDDEKL